MRILLINNDGFSMLQFRSGLICRLVALGHDVHVAVPPDTYADEIGKLGATVHCIEVARFMSPAADLRFMAAIWHLCRKYRFDMVHTMTAKPNIFGVIAARLAGVKSIFGLVSGAGFAFMSDGRQRSLSQRAIPVLFRLAFTFTHRVWFQNPDDAEEFVRLNLVAPEKVVIIKGSGINFRSFDRHMDVVEASNSLRATHGIPGANKVVLMVVARRIWSKGIQEFMDAATNLEAEFPDWTFVLVAPTDHGSPDLVPNDYIESRSPSNLRVVSDFYSDIRPFHQMANIVTLPSYYREGVPRCLLEGMAYSCAVVTTDGPGCREAVVNGKNGLLIPAKDAKALSAALRSLMSDEKLRADMGQAGRQLAETVFSEDYVVDSIVSNLYAL